MQHPAMTHMWAYRLPTWLDVDLTDFEVEAVDGDIGKVDEASREVGAAYIVVATGPWILGKKVMLPAGLITDVDLDRERVFVDRTKDQIESAPEFDENRYRTPVYRDELEDYYSVQSGMTF